MALDTTEARVLGPLDGDIIGPEGYTDRFMVEAKDSGGGFALVEHVLGPHMLAAPLHLHTREDEYSYVLEGRVGALLGEEEVFAEVGDLIFKPRGQWHRLWNAGDVPVRILEIISPGGFEQVFREFGAYEGLPDPETLAAMAARYRAEVDFERTMPLIERHGLVF